MENLHPQCVKTGWNEKVSLLVRDSFCTLWIEIFQFLLVTIVPRADITLMKYNILTDNGFHYSSV